jgi:hypothetical protein
VSIYTIFGPYNDWQSWENYITHNKKNFGVIPKENELLEDFEKDGFMLEIFDGDETVYWVQLLKLLKT